jgi:hypothetical protein
MGCNNFRDPDEYRIAKGKYMLQAALLAYSLQAHVNLVYMFEIIFTSRQEIRQSWCRDISGARTRGADKSLARPTSRCILFDGENISFDASLVIYINSTNIPPIMIINRIYEHQNLLSL